jgi:peroxiredoxin
MGALMGAMVAMSLTAAGAAEVGKEAPAFSLKNTKGATVSLADYKGKVVVLEWINYDCPFVKKHYASGNMAKLQEKYADQGVVWLSVSSAAPGKQGNMPAADLQARAEKDGSKASAILLDEDGKVGKAYGATNTPHMFVINKQGVLAYSGAIDDKPTTEQADVAGASNFVAAALDAVLAGKDVEKPKTKAYGCDVKY